MFRLSYDYRFSFYQLIMRALFFYFLVLLFVAGCSVKKNPSTTGDLPAETTKLSLPDSIDIAIGSIERRLDVKMKRKVYEPQPGKLVTLQKWFEFGDTTRLVKLREEILTSDTKMEVIQYHFLSGKLAQIHDYTYDKKCADSLKQCMDEGKYYFANDTINKAIQRHAEGTNQSPPQIEAQSFQPTRPEPSFAKNKAGKLAQIMKKYASLPYAKPRPEKGTR